MTRKSLLFCQIIILNVLASSCGQSNEQPINNTTAASPAAILQYAVKTAENTAPKDTETPPDKGGYGFEAIAESLGYQTYVITPEEQKYFGDPRAVKGGLFTFVSERFPITMRTEGQHAGYSENSLIRGLMFETLLMAHPVTREYVPLLASHWKISADKMQFWFRVNPDARWSDGEPVTAEDVIASWNFMMDETLLEPSNILTYEKFERPTAEGKYLVTVKCKDLNWRNLLYFGAGMAIYPAHILKNLTGADYQSQYQFKALPGTGPYTFFESDFKNSQSFTMTRRLDYWGAENPATKHLFNFDKIKFGVVKDNPSLIFEQFKKGDFDFYLVMSAQKWAEETDFDNVKNGWIQKRRIFTERANGMQGYMLNMRQWPFDDKRIRHAFMYLFNREELIQKLYRGQYIIQNSMFSGSVYENPNNEKFAYNPEKAMQLLAEAGWKERNANGWLVKDGKEFRIEIGIEKSDEATATPFQQMLKEYGIDLQLKFVDSNASWKGLMERTFTMDYMAWGGSSYPNPESMFHSSLADKNDNTNIFGFKNKRVDELCALYDKEFDRKKQIEILREIDGIVWEELPFLLILYAPYQRVLFWNRVSYPEYMLARYDYGDYRDVFTYWWFDSEKIAALEAAKKNNTTLPVASEVDVKYWEAFKNASALSDAK